MRAFEIFVKENVGEAGMPSSVIRSKQKYDNMTPTEFKNRMDNFFAERNIVDNKAKEDHMYKIAWRYGYGKMSPYYIDKYFSADVEEGSAENARALTGSGRADPHGKKPGVDSPAHKKVRTPGTTYSKRPNQKKYGRPGAVDGFVG